MSALREEFHHVVDELPDSQVGPLLAVVRREIDQHHARREALATLDRLRQQMSDVDDVDEDIQQLRDDPRG